MPCSHHVVAKVILVQQSGSNLFTLRLEAPAIARAVTPGQFVMLGPLDPQSMDPFLCRPLSVYGASARGYVDLLIAVAGRGTRLISGWTSGTSVELTGPLGHGFQVPQRVRRILLVGGGVGVAPLVFLANSQLDKGRECILFYGAESSEMLVDLKKLESKGCKVRLTTDDGSKGHHGLVTDLLIQQLQESDLNDTLVASCGPWPMLEEVYRLCSVNGIEVQVSLENRMACGTGACMGCSMLIAGKPQRVCKQGPVFSGGEVFE